MITITLVPADTLTSVRGTGWLHDCGAFVYSPTQPDRCGVCWSALRNGQARNGSWQLACVTKEAS
ncbi:hypothetical protein ACGFIF_24955 [Kribbella sp. NPDC049174]|uniref:hypothetical protein n=1 Tax=Kribbella sp. NPDC049174 TaxID=3364112 RepID=UPI003716CFAB